MIIEEGRALNMARVVSSFRALSLNLKTDKESSYISVCSIFDLRNLAPGNPFELLRRYTPTKVAE